MWLKLSCRIRNDQKWEWKRFYRKLLDTPALKMDPGLKHLIMSVWSVSSSILMSFLILIIHFLSDVTGEDTLKCASLPHSQVNGRRSGITEAFCLLCRLVILWSSWLWFSRHVVDLCICCWAYTSTSCFILSVSIVDFYTARHTTQLFVSSLCGARCVGGLLNIMSEPQLGILQDKTLQSQFIHEQYVKTFEAPKY